MFLCPQGRVIHAIRRVVQYWQSCNKYLGLKYKYKYKDSYRQKHEKQDILILMINS